MKGERKQDRTSETIGALFVTRSEQASTKRSDKKRCEMEITKRRMKMNGLPMIMMSRNKC